MDPITAFLLLLLFSRKDGSGSFWPSGSSTTTAPKPPSTAAPAAAANFPATQPASVVPVSYPVQTQKWVPYKPLNAHVIARAQQILNDPSKPMPSETVEKDAAGRPVRYVKLNAPAGKKSVVATMPNPALAQNQSTAI